MVSRFSFAKVDPKSAGSWDMTNAARNKAAGPSRFKLVNAWRDFLSRWRRTTWPDRALLCEAMLLLAFARIVIAVLPFRTVGRIAGWIRVSNAPSDEVRAATVRRVGWAIGACAKRAPFRAVCFQQGLAAQIMLRRRGVPSILHFGAAPDVQNGLVAHVSVRDGDTNVVGGEDAARFPVLITFPPIGR